MKSREELKPRNWPISTKWNDQGEAEKGRRPGQSCFESFKNSECAWDSLNFAKSQAWLNSEESFSLSSRRLRFLSSFTGRVFLQPVSTDQNRGSHLILEIPTFSRSAKSALISGRPRPSEELSKL
jgi:hypothetical protein